MAKDPMKHYQPEASETVNYRVDDFVERDSIGEYRNYVLNKSCIILNKRFEPLKVEVHTDFALPEYIAQINNYIQWLGGECKTELIEYFNKSMTFVKEKADDEWYRSLEIYRVAITLNKNEKLCATIACGDAIFDDHILDIETEEGKIYSMGIDG
jgi:hypothetical protein